MPEFSEALEQYMDAHKMYHFEGEQGVRYISNIAEVLGYRQGISEMLEDNPFLQEALINAFLNFRNLPEEWTEKLLADVRGER